MNSSAPRGKTWLGRAGATRWASASQFGAAAGLIGAAGALAWVVARPPAPTNLDSRRVPREARAFVHNTIRSEPFACHLVSSFEAGLATATCTFHGSDVAG